MTWPCQRNPERWFSDDRKELGKAVHGCLSHCPRLVECGQMETPPMGGVLAGVHYVTDPNGRPAPERRTLHEVRCAGCEPDPQPKLASPKDTAACGTPKGFQRHKVRGQEPCGPCYLAKQEYQRERYRTWARKQVSV